MPFEHAIWLIVGLAACALLGWGFHRFQKKGQAALEKFAAGHLLGRLTENVSSGRRMVKRVLLVAAVAAIFVALARPQIGYQWKEVKRKGIDILMAVDTSRSMLAEDVRPNRLERSKLGIMDFISRLEGDRVGLIPFAGTAFLMCPLTLDYDAFRQSLDALDTQIIPQGGTDIARAIEEADAAFSNDAHHKILILVTDGEDLEGEALNAARKAARKGMTIYTVGVGTPAGERIPMKDGGRSGHFVKDDKGEMVTSRLDETTLREVAQVTGGQYEPLGQQAEGLDAIYQQKLSLVPKEELAQRMQRTPIERFEWPLLLAIVLLGMEFVLSDRKWRGKRVPVIQTADRRILTVRGLQAAAAAVVVAVLLVLVSQTVHASAGEAEQAYQNGDYPAAVAAYREAAKDAPADDALQFNLGAAAYKGKAYDDALTAFQTALNTQDIPLQNKAYYNMGNTLYRMGEGTEKTDPQKTIEKWEASLKAYDGALKLDPADPDAGYNQAYVKKRLEALRKQQEEKKKDCSCPNKDNKEPSKNPDKNQNKDQSKDQNQNQHEDQRDQKENQRTEQNSQQADNPKDNPHQNPQQASHQDANKGNKDQDSSQGGKTGDPRNDANRQKDERKDSASRPDDTQDGKDSKERAQRDGKTKENAKSDRSDSAEAVGTTDQKASGSPGQAASAQQAGRDRRPGQMTEEQARALLDSLKGDEKGVPMMAGNRGQEKGGQEKERRDW